MSEVSDISAKRNIINCIRKIAGVDKLNLVKADICNVDAVDEDNGTIDCTSIMGEAKVQYKSVLLNAQGNDGIIGVPAKDSNVVILTLKNNQSFVISISDLDKYICIIDANNQLHFDANGFVLNGGNNGGIINIVPQTAKLNQLVTELQAQLVLIASGIVAGGGTYTPGTLSTFNKTDFEDLKFKH